MMMVGSMGPVSYTHLDVYKRQVSFWFMRRSSLSGMASPFDGKLIFQAIVSAGEMCIRDSLETLLHEDGGCDG